MVRQMVQLSGVTEVQRWKLEAGNSIEETLFGLYSSNMTQPLNQVVTYYFSISKLQGEARGL